MTEISEVAERVAARRAELDEEEKLLVERLEEVRAEREELAAAMRVWERMHAQLETEKAATNAVPAQVGGRGVLLVAHREAGIGEEVLPPDYQRIMKIVREAGGPVRVKEVGKTLGLEVQVKGRLEPLRGKLTKPSGRGWLRKLRRPAAPPPQEDRLTVACPAARTDRRRRARRAPPPPSASPTWPAATGSGTRRYGAGETS